MERGDRKGNGNEDLIGGNPTSAESGVYWGGTGSGRLVSVVLVICLGGVPVFCCSMPGRGMDDMRRA